MGGCKHVLNCSSWYTERQSRLPLSYFCNSEISRHFFVTLRDVILSRYEKKMHRKKTESPLCLKKYYSSQPCLRLRHLVSQTALFELDVSRLYTLVSPLCLRRVINVSVVESFMSRVETLSISEVLCWVISISASHFGRILRGGDTMKYAYNKTIVL